MDTPNEPAELLGPRLKRRVCTGARLGNKRPEVERMLLEGEAKLKIARALKISPHSVRAVERQMSGEPYVAPSGKQPAPAMGEGRSNSLPAHLKNVALRAVNAITDDKLKKATPQACALVADRLLNRADALEGKHSSFDLAVFLIQEFGAVPSHSVSRLTMEQKLTVESTDTPPVREQ
jgi:hypothetical protein